MDALTLLRDQVAFSEDLILQVTQDITAGQSVWRLDGSTANPIAMTLLHVYVTEDRAIQTRQGKPLLIESGAWQKRIGVDPSGVWAATSRPDPATLRSYADEVRAVTRAYLDGLDPAALDEAIDSPRGARPFGSSLALLLVTHKLTHLGEISALLGCQGVRGFPF